jgi:hypothetical protein
MFVEPDPDQQSLVPARPAPTGPSSFWEVSGAALRSEIIETDWYMVRDRRERDQYQAIYNSVSGQIGEEALLQAFQDRGVDPDRASRRYSNLSQSLGQSSRTEQALLDIAGSNRFDGDLESPRTRQDVRASAIAELREEWNDAQDTLAMGGNGSAIADFLGRAPIAVSDPTSLLMLPLGGAAGGIVRTIATEAVLGGLGEALILPRMGDVAEELDIPEPNALAQIAMGTVAGGTLGGIFSAAGRGIQYARIRREIPDQPLNMPNAVAQTMVAEMEEVLATGRQIPEPAVPDVPDSPDSPDVPAAPAAIDRPEVDQEISLLEASIEETRRSERAEFGTNRRPVTSSLIGSGIYIHPDGNAAAILREADITPRSAPGLFRRNGGQMDMDGLPASESPFEGIVARNDDGYLDPEDLLQAIVEEIGGNPRATRFSSEIAEMQVQIEDLRRGAILDEALDAVDARIAEAAPRDRVLGFGDEYFLTPDEEGFFDLGASLDRAERAEGVARRYSREVFEMSETEQLTLAQILADRGGYVEDAAERVAIMNIHGGRNAGSNRAVEGGPGVLSGRQGDVGEDIPFPIPARADQAGDGPSGGAGSRPASEVTAAGDQTLIEGVAPVTQRERMEAEQNRRLQGGDAAADVGLFDSGARFQRDMFDDLNSPEAQIFMDAKEAELRQDLEGFDDVEVPVDGQNLTARTIFREMEEDSDHLAAIEACRLGGSST